MRIGLFTAAYDELVHRLVTSGDQSSRQVLFSQVKTTADLESCHGVFVWICDEIKLKLALEVLRDLQKTEKLATVYCDRSMVEPELAMLMDCFPRAHKVLEGVLDFIKVCMKTPSEPVEIGV